MCGCDWNYVCAEHRGTPLDWREGDQLPDPLEDERNDRLEPPARPSLNPES